MKRCITLFAAFFVVATGLSVADAAIIVNDTFEGYTSQANFEATWTPIGTVAPLSGEWSTEQSTSPTHSIKNPGTAVSNQSRNQLTFPATPAITVGSKLVWSFDYWDNAPAGNPQRNYVNLQTVAAPGTSPAGQLISMGLNNNQLNADSGGPGYMARILGYAHPAVDAQGGPGEVAGGTASGAYFKMNDIATGGRGASAGWRNLKLELSTIDGTQTKYDFFVNNALAETEIVPGAPLQYTLLRMGSGLSNGSVPVYFDNMFLEFVPANTAPTVVDHVDVIPNGSVNPGSNVYTHQFQATDLETPLGPFTWDQLSLLSYTENYGNQGPPPGPGPDPFAGPGQPPTLSASGLFSWTTDGSPRGDYVFQVRATDPGGLTDLGTIRLAILAVPEPSALVLFGLAMIGGLGMIRRRAF